MKRREFLKCSATMAAAPAVLGATKDPAQKEEVTLNPYRWEGPYAQYRSRQKALHDWRLCAEVKANWFRPCERIILRTSEIIGHENGFLYDDHFPPSESDGRGKSYQHIPFGWQVVHAGSELSADCLVPNVGRFTIGMRAHADYIDIALSVRNSMRGPMLDPDWAFCAVGFETFSVADPEDERTFLYDGEGLRSFASISGRSLRIYKVDGANGFIPVGHRRLPIGDVQARASVIIIEAVDGIHSIALGFQQADQIYGDARGNRCFHADPYFGKRLESGEESKTNGRLYLMEGNAEAALQRYLRDFSKQSTPR